MHEHDDLENLPIVRELGVSIRAAAAREDDRLHRVALARSRRRRRLTLSTVATSAVVAVVVIAVASGTGGPGASPANAAPTLNRAALVAASQPDELPAPEEYFYVRSTITGFVMPAEATDEGLQPQRVSGVREIWQSLERPGRLLTTPQDGTAGMPTPGNGKVGNIPALRSYRLGSLRLSRSGLAAFPTDPATIYARFRGAVGDRGPTPDAQVFDDIVEALGEQPAPSQLRGGLYRALARVPGVKVITETETATTIAVDVAGVRREASFDPNTAELLATRVGAADPARSDEATQTTYERRAVTISPFSTP